MSFRFTIHNGDNVILTPWYKEHNQMAAPMVAEEIRMEYPDASFEIERQNVRPDKSLDAPALDALLTQLRTEAGWTEEEIKAGVKAETTP